LFFGEDFFWRHGVHPKLPAVPSEVMGINPFAAIAASAASPVKLEPLAINFCKNLSAG